MNRRDFLKFLSSGTLAAMLVPTVAKALESGIMSSDDVYNLIQDTGGEGVLIHQEGRIVARTLTPPIHSRVGLRHADWAKGNNPPPNQIYFLEVHSATPVSWQARYLFGKRDERDRTIVKGAYRDVAPPTHDRVQDGEVVVMAFVVTGPEFEADETIMDFDAKVGRWVWAKRNGSKFLPGHKIS